MAGKATVSVQELSAIRKGKDLTWEQAVRQADRSVPDEVAERIGTFLEEWEADHDGQLPRCAQRASLDALEQASLTMLDTYRNPTLAEVERIASAGPDDELYWFEILARFEPLKPRAKRLTDEEKRLVVYKFRLFRIFEKLILAEFEFDSIAGYLIPSTGDIRSRVCLAGLKALLTQAVRRGRRKAQFNETVEPTHRVDSVVYQMKPRAVRGEEPDEIEMAYRRLYTVIDGPNLDDVHEVQDAFKYLFLLRQNGVLVENPPPPPPRPAPEPPQAPAPAPQAAGPEPEAAESGGTFSVACPECGKRLKVPTRYAGRRGRCPACSHVFDLPASPS